MAQLGEFDLIDRFFRRPAGQGPRHAVVGNGDDCAVLAPRPGWQLAISTDTLVEGRHFLSTVDPTRLGHKALAVNLSDLAACGAEPLAFTLALTLPRVDEHWLQAFAHGLLALADEHGCELVGGDTTAGPLSITITALGQVPAGQALLRRGAQPGDDLWLSGWPGEARLALEAFRGTLSPPLDGAGFDAARRAMEMPSPRVALGQALRGLASAAIDVSDGLLGDLAHVLRQSGVGAVVSLPALPASPLLASRPESQRHDCVLAGGDDYELLFTATASRRDAVQAAADGAQVPVWRIGRVVSGQGVQVVADALDAPGPGTPVAHRWGSFDHFSQ